MVSKGSPVGEKRKVGGAVFPLCEAAPQQNLVFRPIIRSGTAYVPGDGSVLEIQGDRERERGDEQELKGRGTGSGYLSTFWSGWGW